MKIGFYSLIIASFVAGCAHKTANSTVSQRQGSAISLGTKIDQIRVISNASIDQNYLYGSERLWVKDTYKVLSKLNWQTDKIECEEQILRLNDGRTVQRLLGQFKDGSLCFIADKLVAQANAKSSLFIDFQAFGRCQKPQFPHLRFELPCKETKPNAAVGRPGE